jgi:hypothetical protein
MKMPNWVYIGMEVTGKLKDLIEFRDGVKGKREGKEKELAIDTLKIIPYPKDLQERNDKCNAWEKLHEGMLYKDNADEDKWLLENPSPPHTGGECCDFGCENWGSKWGICDPCLETNVKKEGDSLHYSCQSPWGVPDKLILKMSELYPKVNILIDTEEESNAFIGEMEWENGELVRDDTHEPTMLEIQENSGYTDAEMEEYYGKNWRDEK